MPHFKSINFYQIRPKIKLLLQRNTKCLSTGNSARGPQTPETVPLLLQISGFAPGYLALVTAENMIVITCLITKLPWQEDSKRTFRSSIQTAIGRSPVHHTR